MEQSATWLSLMPTARRGPGLAASPSIQFRATPLSRRLMWPGLLHRQRRVSVHAQLCMISFTSSRSAAATCGER
eukprot:4379904-Lingulodinium_polyedra.AAC.1